MSGRMRGPSEIQKGREREEEGEGGRESVCVPLPLSPPLLVEDEGGGGGSSSGGGGGAGELPAAL